VFIREGRGGKGRGGGIVSEWWGRGGEGIKVDSAESSHVR